MSPVSAPRTCLALILAAGEGVRMQSRSPKVLHRIASRSMLGHVLAAVAAAGADAAAVVVGPDRPDVRAEALVWAPQAEIFTQIERRGTAHAVLAAESILTRGWDDILIAFGDTPLVTPQTLDRLRRALAEGASVAVLGFEAAQPDGYGRLLQDEKGDLCAIREHKDASEQERGVRLCNAGLMAIAGSEALALLRAVTPQNAQNEFYLTDIVAIARQKALRAVVILAPEAEVMGVNDRVQLAAAEREMQNRLRRAALLNGATLQAPETVYFSFDTTLGRDVVVEPNVVFGPGVAVADGVVIHAFSHLEGARVAEKASIGPFGRLRPGTHLEAGARIGNFVEIKAAVIGAGAKVNHLSYIGDASVGPDANIGAGVVTCNYNGFQKFRTDIGAGAFIGTNSALVAPVAIGANAYVGSGSVITGDVPAEALALGRGRQINKAGWARAFRQMREKKTDSKI